MDLKDCERFLNLLAFLGGGLDPDIKVRLSLS